MTSQSKEGWQVSTLIHTPRTRLPGGNIEGYLPPIPPNYLRHGFQTVLYSSLGDLKGLQGSGLQKGRVGTDQAFPALVGQMALLGSQH